MQNQIRSELSWRWRWRWATGLLILMAALIGAATLMPRGPWRGLLDAAGRAGLIGGLADWFAVVALFRRPLGLPIPHTALIPRQKDRLAHALGQFIAEHIFTRAELGGVLMRADLAARLAGLLETSRLADKLAAVLSGLAPKLLRAVGEGQAGRIALRLLLRLTRGAQGGVIVAQLLQGLVAGGHHQAVLSVILTQLRTALQARESSLRDFVEDRVREQGGRLVGWAIGGRIAGRVLDALQTELDRAGLDESGLRDAFDDWIRAEIVRLDTDPAHAAMLGRLIQRALIRQPAVRLWIADLWARLTQAVASDAADPQGRLPMLLRDLIGDAAVRIRSDAALGRQMVSVLEAGLAVLLPDLQAGLAGFVTRVIAGWDDAALVRRLEHSVGAELQYIRINGTVLGMIAGGVLYLVTRALGAGP